MKLTVIVCDNCKVQQKNEKFHKLSMYKERRSNGVESENWYWVADLCPECTSKLATRLTLFLTGSKDQIAINNLAGDFNCREE